MRKCAAHQLHQLGTRRLQQLAQQQSLLGHTPADDMDQVVVGRRLREVGAAWPGLSCMRPSFPDYPQEDQVRGLQVRNQEAERIFKVGDAFSNRW